MEEPTPRNRYRPPVERRPVWPWVLLALVLIPLVVTVAVVIAALGGINQTVQTLDNLFAGRLVMRTEQPAVVTQVRQLSRLETASFTIEKVIEGGVEQGNALLDALLGDRLLFIAHGDVTAGVDLSELQESDILVGEDKSVTLRLPGARILTYRLDNQQSRVYDRQTGLLSGGDPNLETQVRQTAEREILAAACQGGILAQANANAETQVRVLLLGLGFTRIDFLPARAAADAGCP